MAAVHLKFCSVFEEEIIELFKNVSLIDASFQDSVNVTINYDKDSSVPKDTPQTKSGMSCLVCKITKFDSLKAQRDHFKLDWHRYNIKQRLMGKPVVKEEDFEETISGELSSISGSDTEDSGKSDDDDDFEMEGPRKDEMKNIDGIPCKQTGKSRNHPKIFLLTKNEEVLSLYRTTVYSTKNVPENDTDLINGIKLLPKENLWVIIMLAGGHFAAAVFDSCSVVAHKTFHRYTVRAKRGTAQGLRDSKQGAFKGSAGANLRRYNEAALAQDIQELLETWSEHLQHCHRVFIRIPTYNKPMIFGGKKTPLNRNDPRLRTIPFATRRPTFKEVKRVHEELSRVEFLGSDKDILIGVINSITKDTSRPQSSSENLIEQSNDHEEISDDRRFVVKESDHETNLNTCSNNKKKERRKEKLPETTKSPEKLSPEQVLWKQLNCAICSGNTNQVKTLLSNTDSTNIDINNTDTPTCNEDTPTCNKDDKQTDSMSNKEHHKDSHESEEDETSRTDRLRILNSSWGEMGGTLLHTASKHSQTDLISVLLHHGADPCLRDTTGKTAYDKAKTKEARDQFRRFMGDYPDAFDYSKSHIPSPLTKEMQNEKERKEAEKKKNHKKAKKQRMKEQKAAEKLKLEKELERQKQEQMSDREKRALAAEKRFANQLRKNTELTCEMCSKSLVGSIPFERLIYKYCSTECVRNHRLLLETKVSR